jgi:hypothetical protein
MKVIRIVANMWAELQGRDPAEGQYLQSMDFEAHGGRGHMTTTRDVRKAMLFLTAGDAMAYWQTQSKTVPLRDDGKPNRPLTAYTIDIGDAP